jgi:predicted GNAT family acetyltransferase
MAQKNEVSHENEAGTMVALTGDAQDTSEAEVPAPASGGAELTITENPDVGIYEAALGGVTVAGVVYSRSGDHVTLLATSVFPQFRGKGIAARLLSGVLDDLRAAGDRVTVSCPFATAFVRSHPEYADMIVDDERPVRQRH